MSNNVIIMNFDSESKSYQAFSEIKKLHVEKKIKGEQMAILVHQPNHQLEPKEFIDFNGPDKNMKGGLIGMLVGVLAGPLGVLLGWFTGSIIGSVQDAKEVKEAMSVFEETVDMIHEGDTGLILIADEEDNRFINELVFQKLEGRITRLTVEDVEKEIEIAKETQETVEDHAKKSWFDRK
ncbi:DUF1269 domain-containing protein [Carnobacterium gallinarum]|uniref:DUF1269 domain-containing protein n=1 Tax=Carnobacterium gallinarum TaxID=2749 RepID=UPI0005536831|nr:DUF1269 domain-containing protein [Carnobacterium gallinarum]